MEEILHYCTYFDKGYLYRGLALYHSLVRHSPSFVLWVLCFDDATFQILTEMQLRNLRPISLSEFEQSDNALTRAKLNRNQSEYYFTCSPLLPLFIFETNLNVNMVTYLDADLFFYSSSEAIYHELGNNSVLIIEHRFPPHLRHMEVYGIFNVGLLVFRRDEQALKCLHWWRERCLEWCYDYVDNGRFADQKYLDEWPSRFQNVVVLRHKGANLAPWNLGNYNIHTEGSRVWVDEQPLICFHFQGFRQIMGWLYDPNLAGYNVKPSRIVRRSIYAPYIQTLLDLHRQALTPLGGDALHSSVRYQSKPFQSKQASPFPYRVVIKFRVLLNACRTLFARQYILFINGRVI
jgi:hypothetical protein